MRTLAAAGEKIYSARACAPARGKACCRQQLWAPDTERLGVHPSDSLGGRRPGEGVDDVIGHVDRGLTAQREIDRVRGARILHSVNVASQDQDQDQAAHLRVKDVNGAVDMFESYQVAG